MSKEGSTLLFLALIANFVLSYSFTDDEFDIPPDSSLIVEHTFDRGPNPTFTKRGTVVIKSIKTNIAEYRQDEVLSAEELNKLKTLVENDDVYRIRVHSKAADGTTRYVSSFTKACGLYESGLTDSLTVHMNQCGNMIGVSITTPAPYCLGLSLPTLQLTDFNTTVEVKQTVSGPAPETQFFIEKMERERAEKTKGQQQDNRSFFAKYWMYIVPVVVLMMLANNADPGAQGGGGR